jgi:hypothetical protein
VRHYWEAETLFAQAAARATTAQAQPPPTLQPPAETRPAPEPQPVGSRADASRTPEPAPPSPPPAAPSSTPPASQTPVQTQPVQPEAQPFDEKGVRSVLSAYAAGFASRNVNDIVKVFPTLPENERSNLASTFSRATQYDLNLECGRIEPVAPNSVIATCVARRSIRFRDGRTVSPDPATLNFRLERRGGSWVIATQLR